MLQQAYDFVKESDDIYKLLSNFSDTQLMVTTQFKNWTFNDIIGHLHVWNYAANLSLKKSALWNSFSKKAKDMIDNGYTLNQFEKTITKGIKGKHLLKVWKKNYLEIANNFKTENPKKRIKWIGPDMSVVSSISARHMETWAHGQSIYDCLGIERLNKDRIRNIVIMGNNTFNWTFIVNKKKCPVERPYLKLIAPSKNIWEFNNPQNKNKIIGLAEDFCKVVTQVRNIKDVNLEVFGSVSEEWMNNAQCFAGGPEKPPEPGSRKKIIS